MNEIVNNFLLAGDKFMSEMHLHTVLEDHLKKKRAFKYVIRYIRC